MEFLSLVLLAFTTAQLVTCSSSNGSTETDRLSLLEFRKDIILDPHGALISWNESTRLCNWEGVTCSKKSSPPPRVISLNLTNLGLVGRISPSLGNLTLLKHLVLSENAFTGRIPPSLGDHLHRLEYLHLSNNELEGTVPDFANLSNLVLLNLGQNRLTGQIPAYLPRSLENLSLLNNNLTGTIPASISNATMLEFLDCTYNNIEGTIPDEFGKLPRMQSLALGGNKLVGRFPNAVLNLSALTGLSLALNGLSGELPSNLGSSLPNIEQLFLAVNFFSGHIPYSLFANASKLNSLDMSQNNLTGSVPSSIGKLTKLLALNLESNQLEAANKKDWEFMYSLANCTELKDLSIARNSLQGRVPDSLGNLSVQLLNLHLGFNKLAGSFPSGVSNFPNLIVLGLSDNRFTGQVPQWIGTLKSIQIIALQSNKFSGIFPSSVTNLSQLGTLILDSNQFSGSLHVRFGNLRMLDTLSMSNNLFSGMIPKEIFGIPALRQIGLSSNNLEGQFPREVGKAKQLTVLEISSNKLSGEIPNTLGNCESLEHVQLDSNSFSGSIPDSLANIRNLHVLNLSHNSLTGSIPLSLGDLQHLEHIDFSFNDLRGQVPTRGIFHNVTAIRVDGNPDLCGGAIELHLQACSIMHLNPTSHNKSVARKVVIPVGILMLLVILTSVILHWRGNLQRSKTETLPSFDKKYPKVSYKDLARATEDFSASNLIGKGRFSSVYQGQLFQEKIMVAIKVFSLEINGAQKSFIAECNALRSVRHRNLVPILTACSSIDSDGNDFKALVYKFMPRGDLHAFLYPSIDGGSASTPRRITLTHRLSIVVDIADALEYLHHNNHGTIVHCDIKPSNILLDENMTAHIGDFGLTKFLLEYSTALSFAGSILSSSIAIRGTIGYVAPESATGGGVSCAGDIYSFGIVLLEIFLRKKPTDDMFTDGLNIVKFVEMSFADRISGVIDPELQEYLHDSLSKEASALMRERTLACLVSVLDIGLRCTKASPSERMDMREVAARLHDVKDAYLERIEISGLGPGRWQVELAS